MKLTKLLLFIVIACFMGCTSKIKNDTSIGDAEAKTYQSLVDRLTKEMKRKFGGNMYQSEKITPIETADGLKIGIPNSISYTFKKDNSKYVKGDLNNDRESDLIIWADMIEGRGTETKKYFLYLQNEDGYQYFAEYKADEMVIENCLNADLNKGIFNLDSIRGGFLIGNSNYQGNHEAYYLDYSYRCVNEKYKLNRESKELKLVYQSDLLKKNDKTGVYEKVEKK